MTDYELVKNLRTYGSTGHPGRMGDECIVGKSFLNEVADRLEALALAPDFLEAVNNEEKDGYLLYGIIDKDYDGWATVDGVPFANFMYNVAEKDGFAKEHDEGLGGKRAFIRRCGIVMYTTERKMSFSEAQDNFLNNLFSAEGEYDMEANYTGYSEWTITGFDLDKCQLGGHDMNQILLSHEGEYANILVKCLK